LRPDEGEARVDGLDVRHDGPRIRRIIGYMPDFLGIYDDLTVSEYLQFFASAFGLPRRRRKVIVDGVLELTDLTEKRDAMVDSLSRGMTQRLGVARVLIHEPKALLLDEPASGLDPRARIEMRSLLAELGRMGKSVMISSHILGELEELCDSIGIIERGKLVYAGGVDDALKAAGLGLQVEVRLEPGADLDGLAAALEADDRIARAHSEDGAIVVELAPGEHGRHFIVERLIALGARIDAINPRRVRLEDAFMTLTKGAVQ
jgi:ABC-2 type transport system ATP-binding protein